MPGHRPEDEAKRKRQRADSAKAITTSRRMMRNSTAAIETSRTAIETSRTAIERASPTAPSHRSPVILRNGPRDYSVATWLRDEDGEPVYEVVQRGIKAASTAGVLARKLLQKQHARP